MAEGDESPSQGSQPTAYHEWSRTRTTARKSTFSIPTSRTQHAVLAGVPLLPAHIAVAIADGRIEPSPVPAAIGGLVPAEPIQDRDMVIPTEDSEEEEDLSEREFISDRNDDSFDRTSNPASTLKPAGTFSLADSAVGNTVKRFADDA